MLEQLLTEQVNPASENIDALPTEEVLRIINAEDQKVAAAVAKELPNITMAVDVIVDRMSKGGRLFFLGAGTSGRLGVLDAAECPPTFNVSPDLVRSGATHGSSASASSARKVCSSAIAASVSRCGR